MNVQFGSGVLSLVPTSGNLAANSGPQTLGILQEAEIDFSGDVKELFGQQQLPVATARGKLKVTGKAKLALLDPNQLNQIYFGEVATTGVNRFVYQESFTFGSPVVNSYIVTFGSNFVTDYGVVGATTGKQFTLIPSGTPAAGQYKVNPATGTYTFSLSETELGVLINYTWFDATHGITVSLVNQLMGYAPYVQMILFNNFRNEYFAIELFSCLLGKITLPTKQEDFWVVDIDWTSNVNAAGQLGKIYADRP
jgi:hypothetical protein